MALHVDTRDSSRVNRYYVVALWLSLSIVTSVAVLASPSLEGGSSEAAAGVGDEAAIVVAAGDRPALKERLPEVLLVLGSRVVLSEEDLPDWQLEKCKDTQLVIPLSESDLLAPLDAMDSYIPLPEREVDRPFLMPIEDVFLIQGLGTMVTGRIDRGTIKTGDSVEIVGIRDTRTTVVTRIEMFNRIIDVGEAGDNIAALLRGVDRKEVERGQVLAKPGSITPHKKMNANVSVLTAEEVGRPSPLFSGYRFQFFFRTTDITGTVALPEGKEIVMPGETTNLTIELITTIAVEQGTCFTIRRVGAMVAVGAVTEILE